MTLETLDYLADFRADALGTLTRLGRLGRASDDVAQFIVGGQRVAMLNRPGYVRDVLVNKHRIFIKGQGLQNAELVTRDEVNTQNRYDFIAPIKPYFHRERIVACAQQMAQCAQRISSEFAQADANTPLDMHDAMKRLTLAIAAATLFGSNLDPQAHEIIELFDRITRDGDVMASLFGDLLPGIQLSTSAPSLAARAQLDALITGMVAQRRADGMDRGDLFSMFQISHDARHPDIGSDDAALIENVFINLLTVPETTASALTWAWFLLAQHPQAEARLHDELRRVLGGRTPALDDLSHLPYVQAVLNEAIRLYPPAWVIGRCVVQDVRLGDVTLERGSIALVSQWVTQRDERYFADPEMFRPERWFDEAKDARASFAFFPFGGGPHQCIGESFAWTEAQLALAVLGQHWQVGLIEGQDLRAAPEISLRPRAGMRVALTWRPSLSKD